MYFQTEHLVDAGDISVPQAQQIVQPVVVDGKVVGSQSLFFGKVGRDGKPYAPYGPFFAIVPEILPQNVAGVAMALINSFGALGSFVGAYIVGRLNAETGGFGASYLFMAIALLLSSIITIIAVKKPQHQLSS